ncbi:hypothetical protein D3C80_1481960 [compost metagenome]
MISGLQVEIFPGQVIAGACVSIMVKVVIQEELFPARSVTVISTLCVPEIRFVPASGCCVSVYPEQLSVTVAKAVRSVIKA